MPGQVKAIIPPEFDSDAVMKTLQTELEKYAPFFVSDYNKTTAGWTGDKPKFTPVVVTKPGYMALQIRVLGPEKGRSKWHWLNDGTKPHKIRPKRAKRLRFKTGYQAGSKPGTTFTTRATPGSGPDIYAQEVNHPGTEARGWSDLIVKENQRPFERWMQAAMKQAARASGHGV